ncbi:MAG: hypothetical protein KDA41_20645 [Planctomycetales bacterium]|nr:hypothetical protein [Planctomycetales bacterium]
MSRRHVLWLAGWSCCGAALLVVGAARGQSPDATSFDATPGATESTRLRIREGSELVKQLGHFKSTGDRLTFHPKDSEEKYLGLENLALERIGKVLTDQPDRPEHLTWEVSGVLTEYRGSNYLLVKHAILKKKRVAPLHAVGRPN